jgi:predicted metal-dependent HD superfamily phosphohydrolase
MKDLVSVLKKQWIRLAGKYSGDVNLVQKLFEEIETAYGSPERHYHNLYHIDALLQLSEQHQNRLRDKDAVDFSIFYHDIIYTVTRSDNEDRSADLAQKKLLLLQVEEVRIKEIITYIKASKTHALNGLDSESDLAWFLDFDMSILGSNWETYLVYTQQIRKEYSIYPDIIYNKGRKNFLQQSIANPSIFHTSLFKAQYERQARYNIEKESESLKI